jgi:hypothetical protein
MRKIENWNARQPLSSFGGEGNDFPSKDVDEQEKKSSQGAVSVIS